MNMALLFLLWFVLLLIGFPVGFALILTGIAYFAGMDWNLMFFAGAKLVDGIDSFALLAVPFFTLTGILMNSSGITVRIFSFAKTMVGHYTGGMGHVNILASLLFSGMSGSALADAGGLGQLEIKSMRDEGYDDDYSGGLTAASCIIGPLVPPSIPLVIYGIVSDQSIAKLFLAGFVPGVLTAACLMVMAYIMAKKRGYVRAPKATLSERWTAFKDSFWALLTPIIIIGGIFSGYYTPTEASVIATLYSIFLGFFVYKELTMKKLFASVVEAMKICGVTVLMIMGVEFFGQVIAREQISIKVAGVFLSFSDNPLVMLFMINALLLFLGTFIEALALLVLLVPILVPIVVSAGIDPVFFGILVILNLMIGILTPPMGMALFVVSRVGKIPVHTITRGVVPFLIPLLITLVILTLFPDIVLFLPRLLM